MSPQKKIILQTGSSGVSVIDVVPIDVSDSSDESPVTVNTISAGVKSGAGGVSEARDDATSGTQQQVTAQVAVVESQSPGDSSAGPHYITVTGKFMKIVNERKHPTIILAQFQKLNGFKDLD